MLAVAQASSWSRSAPRAEEARPLDLLRLQLAQLPASLRIDLLRGAVMDRLRVRLSEVAGLARLSKEASCAPHLPYVSSLPGELCAAGAWVSEGPSLAARCSSSS